MGVEISRDLIKRCELLDSALPERLPVSFFQLYSIFFLLLEDKLTLFNSPVPIHQIKKSGTAEIDNCLR